MEMKEAWSSDFKEEERTSYPVGKMHPPARRTGLGGLNEQLFGEFGGPFHTDLREDCSGGLGLDDAKNFDRFVFRHLFKSGRGLFGRHGFIHLCELRLALTLLILCVLGVQGFPISDKLVLLDFLFRRLLLMKPTRLLKLLLHGFISREEPFQFRLESEETLFFLADGRFTAIEILLTLI